MAVQSPVQRGECFHFIRSAHTSIPFVCTSPSLTRQHHRQHGVFYLWVWICPFSDTGRQLCDSAASKPVDQLTDQDRLHLIPGTGDTDEHGGLLDPNVLPPKAFTVCPSGTDAAKDDNSQVRVKRGYLVGSH